MTEMTDVLGVLTDEIEARFKMPLDQLRAAVAAAPHANRHATDVMHWHGQLHQAQQVLEEAENDLVQALQTAPDPDRADEQILELAQRVDAAVGARDGRAMVVRYLVDPDAIGNRPTSPRPPTRQAAATRAPAITTSLPPRAPSGPAAPVRGGAR